MTETLKSVAFSCNKARKLLSPVLSETPEIKKNSVKGNNLKSNYYGILYQKFVKCTFGTLISVILSHISNAKVIH